MKNALLLTSLLLLSLTSTAQLDSAAAPARISPAELVKILHSATPEKPLILQIGPHTMFAQAHIPGAEFIGATSTPAGIDALRTRVKSLPKSTFIVLYCGCCPWDRCPNVRPGYAELAKLGFTRVKVLYLANNFGADWVAMNYPVTKGE
jgi:thiosulfate/3-mercaptopyruvate sulfurtransferase